MPTLSPSEIRELATLFSTGVSLQAACRKMAEAHPENTAWHRLERRISNGQTLAQACEKTGVFRSFHLQALRIAENAGKLESTLKWLATEIEVNTAWRKKVTGKLLYPFFIFAVMVALVTIVNLVKLPGALALQKTAINVIILIALYKLTRLFVHILSEKADFWLPRFWRYGWMREVGILQKVHDYHWLNLLHWQVIAGVDFASACQHMRTFQPADNYQHAIHACLSNVEKGRALAESIIRADLVFSQVMQRMLTLAEKTGDWESSVQHHLITLEADIRIFDDYLADWLPRFLYLLIIGTGFSVIL